MHRPISRGVGSNMLLTNNIGDGSTLTLDFMSGVLDSRLSFARASTGTFIGSNGYVQTASAGTPRFQYDSAGLPLGLLIEGSATNLLTYSEAFTPDWTDTNITRTSSTATSPANTATALLATASAGNATIIRSAAVGTTAIRSYSIWLRRVTGTGNIQLTQNGGGSWTRADITSSWARYSLSPTNANHQVGIRIVTSGDEIEMWGAQLETGSGITSYIPTAGSTVTRSSDYCTMPASSFITGSPYPQTLLIDCIPQSASVGFPDLIRLFDRSGPTYSYGNEIYYSGASTMSLSRKISATSNTDATMSSGLAYNTRYRIAASISSTAFLGSRNGVTGSGATGAPAALPSSVTHLGIGCNGDVSPVSVMFGTIRQVKFWPVAFDQTTLNGLTTL